MIPKLCNKPCDQCLFSKNKIVSDERKEEIVSSCARNDGYFLCHKGTIKGEDWVCHGWRTHYPGYGQALRIVQALKLPMEEIDPNE